MLCGRQLRIRSALRISLALLTTLGCKSAVTCGRVRATKPFEWRSGCSNAQAIKLGYQAPLHAGAPIGTAFTCKPPKSASAEHCDGCTARSGEDSYNSGATPRKTSSHSRVRWASMSCARTTSVRRRRACELDLVVEAAGCFAADAEWIVVEERGCVRHDQAGFFAALERRFACAAR